MGCPVGGGGTQVPNDHPLPNSCAERERKTPIPEVVMSHPRSRYEPSKKSL